MQIVKEIVFNPKMDRNSLSKSSETNNTIDEPEFENVHSVAEHEAIELSGEARAMENVPYTVSEPTCMVKKDPRVLKSEANERKLTEEDIIDHERSKSNAISKHNIFGNSFYNSPFFLINEKTFAGLL